MTAETEPQTKERPIEARMGRVKCVAFRNHLDDGGIVYDVLFRRLYKDDKGEWKESDRFGREDLLKVARVAGRMADRLYGEEA